MINKMQGDFFGKLNSSKWAKNSQMLPRHPGKDIRDLLSKKGFFKELVVGKVRGVWVGLVRCYY